MLSRFFQKKLQSHALVLTITIAIVVFVFISSFFLLDLYDKHFLADFLKQDERIHQLNSGQSILLLNPNDYKEAKEVVLLDEQKIQLEIETWGVYTLAKIKTIGKDSLSRCFFIGYKQKDSSAIELSNSKSELKIAGNTYLTGEISSPNKTISQAYISSKPFHGKLSDKCNFSSINEKKEFYSYPINIQLNLSKISDETDADSIFQSFSDSTLIIHKIIGTKLSGRILLESKSPIFIPKSVNLSNIIVKAPSITIESNFEGNAQFIATDSIIVGEHVRLHFPSALIVSGVNEHTHFIRIGAETEINGLIQLNSSPLNHEKNICAINENCIIRGEILINGILSLKNLHLEGRVAAHNFITSLGESYYYNTLIDVNINDEILSKNSLFVKGSDAKTMLYVD